MINDFADAAVKVKEESIEVKVEKDENGMDGVISSGATSATGGKTTGEAGGVVVEVKQEFVGQPGASLFDIENQVFLPPPCLALSPPETSFPGIFFTRPSRTLTKSFSSSNFPPRFPGCSRRRRQSLLDFLPRVRLRGPVTAP